MSDMTKNDLQKEQGKHEAPDAAQARHDAAEQARAKHEAEVEARTKDEGKGTPGSPIPTEDAGTSRDPRAAGRSDEELAEQAGRSNFGASKDKGKDKDK
jgi:hypothetical protein